jgi:hypothetical protein
MLNFAGFLEYFLFNHSISNLGHLSQVLSFSHSDLQALIAGKLSHDLAAMARGFGHEEWQVTSAPHFQWHFSASLIIL